MSKPSRFSLKTVAKELRRRKVYPVIAGYAVVAFVVLQLGEITFAPLGLPNWVMVALIALVITGFPVVIVLAWVFDITPTGIRRTSPSVSTDDRPSIAVLPFSDMSPEQDQGYFCEGIAEEILNALTKIPQLSVAARSSSFQYTGGSGDVREIGRELGVKAMLEGSVRKSDNRIRVTAQLVKSSDGYHLWSKSFDEEIKDVFAIQDEIATSIANALLETLASEHKLAINTASTTDVSAYDYYLRGRQFFKRFRKRDMEYAMQMFREAIKIDEGYALAWAGYADCHSFMFMYVDPQPRHQEKASAASRRALELDADLAEAHASRGLANLVCENFDAAEQAFVTAIELNPNLFEAYYYYARTKFHQGDMVASADLFEKAATVDPADYQSRCLRGQILRGSGRLDEAREQAIDAVNVIKRHVKWSPDDARAYHLGAGSLVILGDVDRAKRWLHRAIEIAPEDSVVLYNVACNLAVLGETEKALDYLEQAADQGAVSAAWMRNDEDLVRLRDDPRYIALLDRADGKCT